MTNIKKQSLESFDSFGELLRYARKRTHLTQSELGVLIGYHHSYISYLEKNLRTPDKAILLGRIIPALGLQDDVELTERLLQFLEAEPKKNPAFVNSSTMGNFKKANHYILPASLTSIIGRDHETQTLRRLLHNPNIRLITITGAPGVGKTRLAIHVAHSIQDSFTHGAIFVDLIPIQQSDFVIGAIASVLGKEKTSTQDILLTLKDKEMLIVIDNFEHVLEAANNLNIILENNPNIKILVTSRESLHLRGEQEFPLTPLSLSSKFDKESSAYQLFLERAREIQPNFHVNEENASYIAQICSRLDGLPLAIEIAAAQMRTISPSTILKKLSERNKWLRRELNLPPQQQSLHRTIQWSYDSLSIPEQTLFKRLSVFSGGWTLEAAENICSDDVVCPTSNIFSLLTQLVRKSLVVANVSQDRFTFLESLRIFAYEELDESGDVQIFYERHCEYYQNFASNLNVELVKRKFDHISWIATMKKEHPNFRAALNWAVTDNKSVTLASKLILAISQFLMLSGNLNEARFWLDKILEMKDLDKKISVRLLHHVSDYAGKQGDNDKAYEYQILGLNIAKETKDLDLIFLSIEGMARAEYRFGNYQKAIGMFEEALVHKREGTNKIAIIRTLNYLAICNREIGNYEHALELGLESIALCRNIDASADLVQALIGVGEVYVRKKEYKQALPYQCESLELAKQLSFHHGIGVGLSFLAHSIHHLGNSLLATRMESASHKLRQEIGVAPSTPTAVEKNQKFYATLQSALGKGFQTEWDYGEKITIEEIVLQALREGLKFQQK